MSDIRPIVITGANKGIGRATVAAALERDADAFVFLGARNRGRGEAAKRALVAEHSQWAERIEVVEMDVADDVTVAVAASTVARRLEDEGWELYGIVNNAGIGLGDGDMSTVLDVNTFGPRRVCEAFIPMLADGGRVVNVSSASGPNFVAECSPERQDTLTNEDVTWHDVQRLLGECVLVDRDEGDFQAAGFGDGSAYGLSKACVNAYTIMLAAEHPRLTINACTPGFIETDMTRPYAESRGVEPEEMGMKKPSEGTRAQMHLLFGEPGGSGWYFGSDAERSPLDRYRSPGDPPYTGD